MAVRDLVESLSAFFRSAGPKGGSDQQAFLAEMTERVVLTATPKIKAVRGYKKQLMPAIARSTSYFEEAVRRFHGPVLLGKATWVSDPLVNACFTSVEQLESLLRKDPALRAAADRPDCREVYFLLTMSRREDLVYGSTLVGDLIRRDVPQEVVTFSDHRCVAPGITLQETNDQMIRLALELLASLASARILETRRQLEDLERERTSLGYELKIVQLKVKGLGQALAEHGEVERDLNAGGKTMAHLDEEIARLKSEFSDLKDYLTLVEAIFSSPGDMLRFEDTTLAVNRAGIKNYTGTDDPSRPIRFTQLSTSERSRAAFLAVSPVDEILDQSDR
ncbi:hypothetical protein [Desulfocurvibacter africanus]|uniref:hypothetical protein n=1 Tax=Desulfocurvibacter africanus TaxID=873 RepID=UPI00040CC9E5|nr:hypothetical protein [Desulfocurvibacter africanus]